MNSAPGGRRARFTGIDDLEQQVSEAAHRVGLTAKDVELRQEVEGRALAAGHDVQWHGLTTGQRLHLHVRPSARARMTLLPRSRVTAATAASTAAAPGTAPPHHRYR